MPQQLPPRSAPVTAPHILALGDSLTAGYGLARTDAFPSQLEHLLQARHPGATVRNAGISGDTTASARARLPRLLSGLAARPDLAIVQLGANDLLRLRDPAGTRDDLDAILRELSCCGISTMLAGTLAPALLGGVARRFNAVYSALAVRHGVPLFAYAADRIVGDPALTLADRLHPNARAIGQIAREMLPVVLAALATTPLRAAG